VAFNLTLDVAAVRSKDVYGRILIGDFSERFVASLADWSPADYETHWLESARRILSGQVRSAFVTSFVGPDKAPNLTWWPSYRVGDVVYVQNQLLFYQQLQQPFTPDRLYECVKERETVSEDGEEISEWEMPLNWLADFATSRK
jgi:hypothetical protein